MNIELPDGRLLKIKGDAEGVASILKNHYLGNAPVTTQQAPVEAPLELPAIDFAERSQPVRTPESAVTSNVESPLEMPSLVY